MDLVFNKERVSYTRCTYCNTVLAVGVPCNWLMDRVTVKCGHCNHLSLRDPRNMQCICPTFSHSFCFQGMQSSSTTSSQLFNNTARFGMKMPKKHRTPSAYNHFMRDEIQRIKSANPDIHHREAFSMASKNWAKYDPRNPSTSSKVSV
ncbi:protein DROOPING LEAF-like [Zingiber officinale]|uniref:protein DROOPING LEAF-like n=1 Tax=Zingiber officinale TaxID=94328 RepID=UPI001C4DBA72|nr:protein DROOPING LEAF-like [Zingiber officinale]